MERGGELEHEVGGDIEPEPDAAQVGETRCDAVRSEGPRRDAARGNRLALFSAHRAFGRGVPSPYPGCRRARPSARCMMRPSDASHAPRCMIRAAGYYGGRAPHLRRPVCEFGTGPASARDAMTAGARPLHEEEVLWSRFTESTAR